MAEPLLHANLPAALDAPSMTAHNAPRDIDIILFSGSRL
jgi:hypothetical protein